MGTTRELCNKTRVIQQCPHPQNKCYINHGDGHVRRWGSEAERGRRACSRQTWDCILSQRAVTRARDFICLCLGFLTSTAGTSTD